MTCGRAAVGRDAQQALVWQIEVVGDLCKANRDPESHCGFD
jgi:hypothetical protein